MSRPANHSWILSSLGARDLHTCAGCRMTVEVPRGREPNKSGSRIVNGAPLPASHVLPGCTASRGPRAETHGGSHDGRVYLTAAKEWRDKLGLCYEVCGERRVRDYLGLRGPELSAGQELALVSLHAAVRVYLLDAHDEIDLVKRWAKDRRRDDLRALSEGRTGEQTGMNEGARCVPRAGGAM